MLQIVASLKTSFKIVIFLYYIPLDYAMQLTAAIVFSSPFKQCTVRLFVTVV